MNDVFDSEMRDSREDVDDVLDSRLYLGVDVAGAENTWVAALARTASGARVAWGPRQTTLRAVVDFAEARDVGAVAIDAQLTTGLSEERGFRASDEALRRLLPPSARSWVASFNSLMAVPVRGQMLAHALGPSVGTIIETHPRACLHFAFEGRLDAEIAAYKHGNAATAHARAIALAWAEEFGITADLIPPADGAVDAVVCATVAMLYHVAPERLLRLRDSGPDRRGQGPFWVVKPRAQLNSALTATRSTTQVSAPVAVSGEPSLDDARAPATGASSNTDAVGRPLRCPACDDFEFACWPYGWDAHAGHVCAGIVGDDPVVRKQVFRERYRRLFRR